MEVPECPPTPPILTEGLSSPKAGPASPSTNFKEGSSPSRSGSPEPNCPICLGQLNNKSYSDSCFHKFCFKCLLEWSKVKAECPLCKQKFKSIIHNVKSMEEYDQYTVQQPAAEPQAAERLLMVTMDPWAMSPWFVRRHTTVRRHPNLPQTVRRSNALIQLFDMIPNTRAHRAMREERHALRESQRQALRDARSRLHLSGMDLRRSVYRTNLWAQPLADVTGRYRECSLAFYKRNPGVTHRLIPWISRDLSVLVDRDHISEALDRVNGLLLRHDMRSPQFSQEIRQFFGENTRHFLHELISFARSPFDMMGYDREVTHDSWYPGLDNHTLLFHDSDTSSEDDIMEVPFSPRPETQPPFLRNNDFIRSPSPEPGPSRLFERIPTPPVQSPIIIPTSPLIIDSSTEDEATENNNNEEISLSDVEVVAVLKPKHERTPEIVDLLSDSDEPSINPADLSQPWDPEQASTSHVSVESSSFIDPNEPGPSTSAFYPSFVDSLSNADVKSEDDRLKDIDSVIAKQLQEENSLHVFNLTSDDTSVNYDISTAKKSKHRKSKKKSKRRSYFSSSSDEESKRESRPRKRRSSSYKSWDKDTYEDRTKSVKSKKSKSNKHRSRSLSSSPKRSKTTKRLLRISSDESDHSIGKRPKMPSKAVWQIRENSSSDDMPEYNQPRIRSIVVKRQPIFDSSQSSSPHPQRHRSDSESSWEPNGKHHRKSKSKGKGRGKGKKKSE